MTKFEYGPVNELNIRLEGIAQQTYGEFAGLPWEVKYFLQHLCHAVLQFSEHVKQADGKAFYINDSFYVINAENHISDLYVLNNAGTGMNVMNFRMTAENDCYIEFFSLNQMQLADPVLEMASLNVRRHGRCTGIR